MTRPPGDRREYMLEHHYNEYVAEFFYDRQLEQLRDLLPRARLLILSFDSVINNPDAVFAQICRFLDIAPSKVLSRQKVNASHAYRSVFLDKCLRKGLTVAFGERRATRYYKGHESARPALVKLFQTLNGREVRLERKISAELTRIHAPHLERFQQLIAKETVI